VKKGPNQSLQRNAGKRPFCGSALSSAWLISETLAKKLMRHLLLASLFIATALIACAKPAPLVYAPKQSEGKLPVAVWLHGYRNFPGALDDAAFFQAVADRLNIAIVGIPGTTTLDDDTLQWSEEPVADQAYIQAVLKNLTSKYPLDLDRVALFGFSQGAMVAGDLSMLYPDSYRGALIMSPGGFTRPHFPNTKGALHSRQHYISVCGALEHSGNVEWTKQYAAAARKVTGFSEVKLYEGMKEHTRPPDFKDRFPLWIGAILGIKTKG
jgi:predicted esterase